MKRASLMRVVAAALLVLYLAGSSAYAVDTTAASACKDLNETACKAQASCSWVKASKTAAGKERKAYCRKKPVRQAKKPKPSGRTAPAPAPAPPQ